jgi:hypothetical protein
MSFIDPDCFVSAAGGQALRSSTVGLDVRGGAVDVTLHWSCRAGSPWRQLIPYS